MYCPLHCHDGLGSMLDSTNRPETLVQRAKDLGFSSLAITNHGTMSTVIKHYELCLKNDIKPIIGCEVYITDDLTIKDSTSKYFHLILLAKNNIGYKNLLKLSTIGFLEGFYYKPRIDFETLKKHSEGLICLTACLGGELPKLITSHYTRAKRVKLIEKYKEVFGDDYYLEIQSANNESQAKVNQELCELSVLTNTQLVATSDAHFLTKEELELHRIFINIAQERDNEVYQDCWLKTDEEMREVLSLQIDEKFINKAMINSNVIAEMCNVTIQLGKEYLPTVRIPHGVDSIEEYFRQLCDDGFENRGIWDKPNYKEYIKRLKYEFDIITKKNFTGYFIILSEHIRKCKANGIIINDGRGSGAGSLINYLLYITEVDPLEYNLDFSRFLTIERKDLPDIDSDFSSSQRYESIYELRATYGANRVSQISTYGCLQAKAIIDTVGKVLEIDSEELKEIKKSIPDLTTLSDSVKKNKKLMENYGDFINTCIELEGLPRSTSCHAGGVVVCPDDMELTDFTALMLSKQGEIITQIDMHDLERVGLVKFDFLATTVLDIIGDTLKLITDKNYYDYEWDYTDKKTWELLSSGDTAGVFQLETAGMQEVAKRLKPQNIDELCALISLYRPDTMGEIEHYIDRKFGREEVTYEHPLLETILDKTYGCLIYQEQMMAITKLFGGFTDGEADVFRKALGKKKPELVKSQVTKFIERATQNGFDETLIKNLSDWLVDKGGYSFNLSHGISYSFPSFRCAYLKAHYPLEFMCSVINNQKSEQNGQTNYEGVSKFISECKKMGLDIRYPDINKSQMKFTTLDNAIYFGIEMIKGVSSKIIELIQVNRPFDSLLDFEERCNPDITSIITLIKSGCFDFLNKPRIDLLKECFGIRYDLGKTDKGDINKINKTHIQRLFDDGYIDSLDADKDKCLKILNNIRREEQIQLLVDKYLTGSEKEWEFETLSFFLNGTPFDELKLPDWERVQEESSGYIAGTILVLVKKKIKNGANKGKEMAFVTLESNIGKTELIVFNKTWIELNTRLKVGKTFVFFGKKGGDSKMLLLNIMDLDTYKKGMKNGKD